MKLISEKAPQLKVNYVVSEKGPTVLKIDKQPHVFSELRVRETILP